MAVLSGRGAGESGSAADDRAGLIPGGATCYSKGDDKFPPNAPNCIYWGYGANVSGGQWIEPGGFQFAKPYLDWGMGLRSVILGHAYPDVVNAAKSALDDGANHTRPTHYEGALAERLVDLIPCAELVAFGKNGSDAVTAAVRLARAATGRADILVDDAPFHASDDWWLRGSTRRRGAMRQDVWRFDYNDFESIDAQFGQSREYAAVVMDPMTFEYPAPGFLEHVRDLCDENGTVLIFDEVITGFRFDLRGAQHVFGVTPDLACFGKAMANGFSVSALVGKRSIMELADGKHGVHAMSSTHGGETHALAAALATIDVIEREDVCGYVGRIGKRLQDGLRAAGYDVRGHPTSPTIVFPSEAEHMKFMGKLCEKGILAPYFAPSFSHTEADVDRTIEAAS